MGSPLSPIVVNIYMERFEKLALRAYSGISPSKWLRYVDDTFVKILISELEAFFNHINSVDPNIKFTLDRLKEMKLAFLDAGIHVKDNGSLGVTVYRKPTHTDQYLLFDSHHPLDHKLGVVRTLFHRADTVVTDLEDRKREHSHLRGALRKCGYEDWVFQKALKPKAPRREESQPTSTGAGQSKFNITLPYVAGLAEKVKRILMKHGVPVSFKPANILRHNLVHPKDKIPAERKSDVVYKVECGANDCEDFYIGETQQTLKARMKQHSKQENSAVRQHMMEHRHKFDPLTTVKILDKETRWFERGVREAVYERMQHPPMNKAGGLRFTLARSWDRALDSTSRHTSAHCYSTMHGQTQSSLACVIPVDGNSSMSEEASVDRGETSQQ